MIRYKSVSHVLTSTFTGVVNLLPFEVGKRFKINAVILNNNNPSSIINVSIPIGVSSNSTTIGKKILSVHNASSTTESITAIRNLGGYVVPEDNNVVVSFSNHSSLTLTINYEEDDGL